MPLTTRCRHCGRLFPVQAQQIKERHGKVDCPQCGKRFDAIAGLLDEAVPSTRIERGDRPQGGFKPPATAPADMLDLNEGLEKGGWMRAMLWSLGILLLIAGLVLQIGWWDRGRWLRHPNVSAAVDVVCEQIGCRPELPRHAGTMEVLRSALTQREDPAGSLQLTLLLVNKAAVGQRLPQLQLELYDEQGGLAAARRFGPELYLADAARRHGLAPGATARLMLDIASPPTPAAAFRVKLF